MLAGSWELQVVLMSAPPGLTLQPADEPSQLAIVERVHDLLDDKRLPRSDRCRVRVVQPSLFDEVRDEGAAAHASIDVLAKFGIEPDGSFQQQRRESLVVEAAGDQKRSVDGRQIVPVLIKRGANSVEITAPKRIRACAAAGLCARRAAAAPWRGTG